MSEPQTGGDCDFCAIVKNEQSASVVLRTEHVVAFFPLEPATLGHTLLVPTRHISDIWDLDETTNHHLGDATLALAHALRTVVRPEGLNIIQSNGEAATQTVPHLHVHLVPRWTNDPMGDIWPTGSTANDANLNDVRVRLRSALSVRGGDE